MRKTLLFAIMALSINAFAQSRQAAINLHHSTSPCQNAMGSKEWKLSNLPFYPTPGDPADYRAFMDRSLIQIIDSVYDWHWQLPGTEWGLYYRYIDMIYDGSNNLTGSLYQQWNGGTWVNYGHDSYAYDAQNNLISHVSQSWNGITWVNSNQLVYSFDANNNLAMELYQIWDGSKWVNSYLINYIYDANHNKTVELYEHWVGNDWENSEQHLFTYDANNNLGNMLIQLWNGSTWVNNSVRFNTYDANNYLTNTLYQTWNGSSFEDHLLFSYTYDANFNLTLEFKQTWSGSAWGNSSLTTYNYDSRNNQTSELYQEWILGQWEKQLQYLYSYDANNFMTSRTSTWWTADGTTIMAGDSTRFYFHTVLGVNDLNLPPESIIVYPNPGNGSFTIESKSSINSFMIYNLQGYLIYSEDNLEGQTSRHFSFNGTAEGIYFIKIYTGSKNYTRKIVVH